MAPEAAPVYALLANGTTVEIRPARPDDFDAVKAMHEAMSPDNAYMRFFNFSRTAAEAEARRICRNPGPGMAALLALADGAVVGTASYARSAAEPGRAEVAFAVADHMHHLGIATLLLEHLVSLARSQQVTTFTAQTLTENRAMLNVFADAGLPVERRYADGVLDLCFPLPSETDGTALDTYLNAVAERERHAESASLAHVLAPESVAVVGASRRRGTVGRAILDNIGDAGYAGRLYAVNSRVQGAGGTPGSAPNAVSSRARQAGGAPGSAGVQWLSSVAGLPEPVDLAVIAVPAAAVLDTARQCGRRGVRSLVVITSGLDPGARAGLLAVCRRHGMRLLGPDSYGVAVPGLGLDATFAASRPRPGVAGLVMQAGGLGFALVDQLSRLGVGISSFASVGHKLDVSSNDMLLWWERDGVTRLAVLSIESFGNPRKFARNARRISAAMPVLTVLVGVPAVPMATQEALFAQAGIITTRHFGELIEATALLATQPVPAGRTVAIVTNVGSAGLLAAAACHSLGLAVHHPAGATEARLREVVPDGGTTAGPVDTTAPVSGQDFGRCLELLAADEEVHAIIALVLPTAATGDLVAAIQHADVGVPLTAVVLNQPESARLLPRTGDRGPVPAYGYPEAAVGALARAVGYGAWRAEPRGQLPAFGDIRAADARTLAGEFLSREPRGGRLPSALAAGLLRCYGIPLADVRDGTEVTVKVVTHQMFGPLVVFGLDGVAAEVFADQAARLTPLTDTDADKLIRSVRSAPVLLGADPGGRPPGTPRRFSWGDPSPQTPLGRDSSPQTPLVRDLRDLLLRVSRLADDLPEVTGLELSPVIAGPDGVAVLDARIDVAPHQPDDPFLRKLR